MPGNETGETSSGLWRLGCLGVILVICAALVPWASRTTPLPTSVPPTVFFSPDANTSVPIPSSEPTPVNGKLAVSVVDVSGSSIERLESAVLFIGDSAYKDSGADGKLEVDVSACQSDRFIFVSVPGYEISSTKCDERPYRISLNPLQASDNPNYAWLAANDDCSQCHQSPWTSKISNHNTGATYDEVYEWSKSGHAKVFKLEYFRSMYRGTTLAGKPSQPARPVILGNEWVPVPAEISQAYHGPGFRLDFPQQPGNCAYCHAPATIQASQTGTYLDTLPAGVFGEGVTCDVCHKVFDVILADTGFPFTDRPGILSFRLMRPPDNEKFMTGPFANIIRTGLNVISTSGAIPNHRWTCTPIFSRSEFCAPCHFGKFGDMVVYNSYGEWKASPYGANPGDGIYRTCQDCHMSYLHERTPEAPSSQRQACSASDWHFQNFNHNVMNVAPDIETNRDIPYMVRNAAEIKIEFAELTGKNTLDFTVNVTNTKAGHKFPTDSPLRHLILVVHAADRSGTPLILVGGDRIPNWAGPGPATSRDYALRLEQNGVKDYGGLPGEIFANLLVEEETNLSPGIAYWNETKPASPNSDTRLRPMVPDSSFYSFTMADVGDVIVNVQLIYRFAFFDLMVWQEWLDQPKFERADILVSEWECRASPKQPEALQQSCKQIGP